MRLNQVISIEKSIKNKAAAALTDLYQRMQKVDLIVGITRTYTPKDSEGEQLPSEKKHVQLTIVQGLKSVQAQLVELFDVTASKDWANCSAHADVVVDGSPLLQNVPVTYLLFLEKKLVDLHTLVQKLPTLDPAEEWHFDEASACWASEPSESQRTKKQPKVITKAPATDKHPAQVELFNEDVIVGFWKTIKFSGAVPATRQQEMLERVERLQKAVKVAREEANGCQAPDVHVGEKVLSYIFK